MARTKISEFSATPGNNTDIDSINIAENCAPSGINDAIRELMAQLKDFQTGAVGDSFNGPVGTTTAAAGAFTTLAASGAVTLSGGTANGVPYLNGSKVLTSGSALVFDGTNLATTGTTIVTKDGVGFRAQTAAADFSHITLGNDNGGGITYLESGKSGTGSYRPLAFFTNGSERMRLDSSGNLGLGVTPSAWNSVFKAIDVGTTASFAGSSSAANVFNNAWYNGTSYVYKTTAGASRYLQAGNEHYWFNAPSGTAGNAITFTQAMTLDASGNLLVGTTSGSGARFNAVFPGAVAGVAAAFGNGNIGNGLEIVTDGNLDWGFNAYNSRNLVFRTNQTERARIDSSGNILFGTTGIGGRGGFTVRPNLGGAATYCRLYLNGNNADDLFYFQYQDTTVGRISITTNSTSYVTSSDYRLKENIAPMTGALAKIAALKPVTYTWKTDGSDGEGFIAHELAEVYPAAVTGEKDAVDAEGKPNYQGIDVSFLVGTLTAALQEAHGLIKELQADVAALKASHP